MGQVEGLEVASIQARALGAERMILRAERVGCVRVADVRAYLLPDHLGDELVGDQVDALVAEYSEDREQLAGPPRVLEPLPADILGRGHAAHV
jgi:hypothetical protein